MSKILGNIYDRSIAMVLKIVETYFVTKNVSKSYIYVFFLSKKQQNWFWKNFHNSGAVGQKKLPDPSLCNVFNLWFLIYPLIWMIWC